MARSRNRNVRAQFCLFDANTALGWRVTRRITWEHGQEMVSAGKARECIDYDGRPGFQLLAWDAANNGDAAVQAALPTATVLSAKEMNLIAGTAFPHGRSKTRGMSEAQRLTRVHPLTRRMLPPEDEIERAQEKLKAFAPRKVFAVAVAAN